MTTDNVTPIRSASAKLPAELFAASIHLNQARGILHTVISLKPKAGELQDNEIAQALYGAVDQIDRAIAIADGTDELEATRS